MNFQRPVIVHTAPNGSVELLLLALFLLILFHGENVVEKPFEDDSIAVNRDIDFVVIRNLFQAPIEILHIFYQQTSGKSEVPLFVLTVIDNVNHDGVLELEVFPLEHLEGLHSTIVVMTCPSHTLVISSLHCWCSC